MTDNSNGKLSEKSTLTPAERSFVERVAEHYRDTDGMEFERGFVLGWVIINFPAKQTANEIAKALDVPREPVDWIAQLLTPPRVLIQEEIPGVDDDYYIILNDAAWSVAVEHAFRQIPNFHSIMQHGLEVLKDQPAERLARLTRMEATYGFLTGELQNALKYFDQKKAA